MRRASSSRSSRASRRTCAEASACLGYVHHRLGNDDAALVHLRRALQLDEEHTEARIYLANILYDRGEYEPALNQLDLTTPEDHWDELGIWRFIELKKSIYKLKDGDGELRPWEARLGELSGEPDDIDEMLADIEQRVLEQEEARDKGQLELFGALLTDLVERKKEDVIEHSILLSRWQRVHGQLGAHRARDARREPAARGPIAAGVHVERSAPGLLAHGREDSDERRRELHSRQRERGAAAHRSLSTPAVRAAPPAGGAARASGPLH